MKEILFSVFICFVFYSCNSQKTLYNNEFKITKIEQMNDWYIIYAQKDKSKYKIVSKKSNNKDGIKIVKRKRYKFVLHSKSDIAPTINGIKLVPQNYLDVRGYSFDEKTIICIEPEKGYYELYFCKDLDGLYLKNAEETNDI